MNVRLMWFLIGVAASGFSMFILSAAGLIGNQPYILEDSEVSEDFSNAFALDERLISDWTRVHQLGALDVWSDATNTTLAITENGQAVQLLWTGHGCCVFDIFEKGEYKATVKYGDDKPRLISQGRNLDGTVWTYVDNGIDGTVDLRLMEDVPESKEQVIETIFETAARETIDVGLNDR